MTATRSSRHARHERPDIVTRESTIFGGDGRRFPVQTKQARDASIRLATACLRLVPESGQAPALLHALETLDLIPERPLDQKANVS